MKIVILGAAGFIGTNLALTLEKDHELVLVDGEEHFFQNSPLTRLANVEIYVRKFGRATCFEDIFKDADLVFHLISTNSPATSNKDIGEDLEGNLAISVRILEACRKQQVKKIIFLSSGGAIYGVSRCPVCENTDLNPITTYGIQKLMIEKLIYLYSYLFGIDYRIIRLSNPYGPYQRPNGKQGAVTTFTYKALRGEQIQIYGDGSNVRDYLYIDDAVSAIINISTKDTHYKLYNVGSGRGISLKEVLACIRMQLKKDIDIVYKDKRDVDLKENYLDIGRYSEEFGVVETVPLEEGILRTSFFLQNQYCR